MSVYKVAQDVEADDKLLGPFTFRQFIYLIIVAMAGAMTWFLGSIFLPLALITAPFVLFFGALALPLRKDQPMEVYLAAIVSFYLKPRKRLWTPDGIESLIEITVPKTPEKQRVKELSQSEAEKRLSYLADIVDTGGWAVRGVASAPQANTAMQTDLYYEAQQTEDLLGQDSGLAHNLDAMISRADQEHKEKLLSQTRQAASMQTVAPSPQFLPPIPAVQTNPQPATDPTLVPEPVFAPSFVPIVPVASNETAADEATLAAIYNPYPSNIHQSVVQPLPSAPAPVVPAPEPVVAPAPVAPLSTSVTTPSPDIMNLANNPDLSVETIAREANRIRQRESEEVVIKLH